MNTILQSLPQYLSKYISDKVEKNPSIVNLSIGEPFFKPPQLLLENFEQLFVKNSRSNQISNKYSNSKGSLKLREAIAKRYRRLCNLIINYENNILVTHGASEAIWLTIFTLTNVGDEVVIPDPSYMLYETAVISLGRVPVRLSTDPNNKYRLNPSDLRKAVTNRTKLLIINSPENPTGAVYSREVFVEIGRIAIEFGFFIMHDEVYDSFIYENYHYNLLGEEFIKEKLVVINSFSKRYSMMGWRLGWIISPNKMIIDLATKMHTNLTLNLGSFHQDIAASILNDNSVDKETARNARQIEKNLKILGEALINSNNFDLISGIPTAGFFLFPNINKLIKKLPANYKDKFKTNGEAVASYLLEEYELAVVPGYIYGKAGNDCIRIVAAVEEETILKAINKIDTIPK